MSFCGRRPFTARATLNSCGCSRRQRTTCCQGWAAAQTLSLVFVRDLAEAVVTCLDHPAAAGKTYFVAAREVVTARGMAEEVAAQMNVWTLPLPVPLALLWLMCLAQEVRSRLTGKPSVLSLQKFAELRAPGWVCDPTLLERETGYACPTTLKTGVAETLTLVSAAALAVKNYTFVDYATQAYIALVGLLILCFHNSTVPAWPRLLGAHAVGLVLVHALIQVHARRTAGTRCSISSAISTLCSSTRPSSVETGSLNRMFYPDYLDPMVARWEQSLFGCQPSVLFMEKLPWLAVSELFYASYCSYYFMVGGVGIALFLRNRQQFFHYVSVLSFVFYVCYLIYILPAHHRLPRLLPPGRGLLPAPGHSTTGRDGRLPRGRPGRRLLSPHALGLPRVRGPGRGLAQQPCGRRAVHRVFLLSLPATHPLRPPRGRRPALPRHGLLPLPLCRGCPGRPGHGGSADPRRQLALLQIRPPPPPAFQPGRLLNAQKLHLEDQSAVWWDLRAWADRAVGEVGRNLELELVPDLHELEAFGPAGNDSIQGETDRLSALHGTVKHGAIEQCAVVMHVHRVGGFR